MITCLKQLKQKFSPQIFLISSTLILVTFHNQVQAQSLFDLKTIAEKLLSPNSATRKSPSISPETEKPPPSSSPNRKAQVDKITEAECSQTMFMTPHHLPVSFSASTAMYSRIDKNCNWKFIGTEPCIPMVSCELTSQFRDCQSEYLEIVDGGQGYMKVCSTAQHSTDPVVNITAADGLRDIYIHYRVLSPGVKNNRTLFTCNVECSQRGEGNSLPKPFHPKTNPKCCENNILLFFCKIGYNILMCFCFIQSSVCGTKPNSNRVVGGQFAQKFEFPWLVALVETDTRQPFCGGSIINNRFILTAAHCIQSKFTDYRNIEVVVNGHEFDSTPNHANHWGPPQEPRTYPLKLLEELDAGNRSKRYNVEDIIVHPLYIMETNDFDLALLKLQEDIDLSPKRKGKVVIDGNEQFMPEPRPICLPMLGTYERTFSNIKAIIAGWGLNGMEALGTSQTLHKLEVNVFSPKNCKGFYGHRVNRRMLCAGYKEGGKDSCSGDSGGPLIYQEKPEVWTQIGSVSWGEGCGVAENPGVYFRITEGVQWINYESNYNGFRQEDGWEHDASATWCINPQSLKSEGNE